MENRIKKTWVDNGLDLMQIPSCIVEMADSQSGRIYRIRHVNSAFCQLTGKHRDFLIGKSFFQAGITGKESGWISAMKAAIEGKRVMKGKLYADILGKWIRFSVSPVHMAHECIVSCVDVSAEEARRRRLHRANTTNETVIRVIRRLVSEPCLSRAMQGILSDLSEAIHPDRLYVLETDRKTISNTYEWCAPGVKSEIESLQNLSYDEYMLSWEKCLETDTSVVIPDIEELRKQGDIDGYNILKR